MLIILYDNNNDNIHNYNIAITRYSKLSSKSTDSTESPDSHGMQPILPYNLSSAVNTHRHTADVFYPFVTIR